MHKTFTFAQSGLEVEVGKIAKQADGATWIKAGNNVVLSTVVASKKEKDFMGFFPLTVEYRERMSAAGKIPGGYIKREGRLSDKEVLTSRLIDRSIRPLFPKYYFKEVQLFSTVYSADGLFPSNILSIIGSSLALTLSPLPFSGPIGAVLAGRIDGEWKFNPTYDESSISDTKIVIAGIEDGIVMVEGYCNNVIEKELVDVIFRAHVLIKEQVAWQKSIQQELGVEKQPLCVSPSWDELEQKTRALLPDNFADSLFTDTKEERQVIVHDLRAAVVEQCADEIDRGILTESMISFTFDSILKDIIPKTMVERQKRLDGRVFDQVRPLYMEVGSLPCSHGSALFQRGETQALVSLTLGTEQESQKYDTLLGGMKERFFMLHYNFPPFSTGEVRPSRGVGRREIGHGYLAETSFVHVLPSSERFPYTVRSVSDILESNGSSSMASVCATTLALMDAGVPISDMVGGIAMGLIKDASGKLHALTDILGVEDAYGLMDFKVTGTETGIMAIQMDVKAEVGLTQEVLMQALEQAREGRLHILQQMKKILAAPRDSISSLAPRVEVLKVNPDKIGGIIGPSGKTIKEIILKTNVQIDIDDDGTVKIYSKEAADAEKAVRWVKTLAGDIQQNDVFEGIIRRFADFGMFVELVPGKDGLVHISTISRDRQRTLERDFKIGDKLTVTVMAYDKDTGRIRLIAPSLKKPLSEGGGIHGKRDE